MIKGNGQMRRYGRIFRTGSKVATATSASAGTASSFDGAKGSF